VPLRLFKFVDRYIELFRVGKVVWEGFLCQGCSFVAAQVDAEFSMQKGSKDISEETAHLDQCPKSSLALYLPWIYQYVRFGRWICPYLFCNSSPDLRWKRSCPFASNRDQSAT
jgi:hypothetical protein